MLRILAKVGCSAAGASAGMFVFASMQGVFEGWTPWASAGVVALLVFAVLYFPLFRPIADAATDRLSTAVQRGRHIRTGSGLDDLPERPSLVRCTICGEGVGPICHKCQDEISRGMRG